jgi:hypothetical protein
MKREDHMKYKYEIKEIGDYCRPLCKRYKATVVLLRDYSKDQIKEIIKEVTEKVKNLNYYESEKTKSWWKDTPKAHVVWLYIDTKPNFTVGKMKTNWLCRTSWIDTEAKDIVRPEKLGGNDSVDDIEIFWNYDLNEDLFNQIKSGLE